MDKFLYLLMEPMFQSGLAAFVLFVIILIWRYKSPDGYKRAKKTLVNFLSTAHHVFYCLASMASLSALGLIAVSFYSQKTVLAIQSTVPELYNFVAGYILTVQVAFLIFISLFFLWKTMTHYHNNLDNGIIDDPDAERRFRHTDVKISQMEKSHREEMVQMQMALSKLAEAFTLNQQAYRETGNRFAENPTPPLGTEERRVIVIKDPSIPITPEEVIATIMPAPEEVVLPVMELENPEEAVLPIQELIEPEKKVKPVKKLKWYRAGDWDEMLFGESGKH